MPDSLSILLESLKVQSASLAEFHFAGAWGFEVAYPQPHSFTVAEGRCWYDFGALGSGMLEQGDSLLVHRGANYLLAHARSLPHRRLTDLWSGNDLYRFNGDESSPGPLRIEAPGDGPAARLFSFAYALRGRSHHPLMAQLPEPLIIRQADNDPWSFVAPTLAFIERETQREASGYAESARQLAELFLTQWVRSTARKQYPKTGEGPRGLEDPVIAKALQALHAQPEAHWSLDRLAQRVGMSRSAFSSRFTERVGLSPMRYLTRWRIQRASELLAQQSSVAAVAAALGYASERTFRDAFKRETGRPPSSAHHRAKR